MHGALSDIERWQSQRTGRWLMGEHLTQADITLSVWACLRDAVALQDGAYPSLAALTGRGEALPEFVATRMPCFAAQI